jgi:tripartite-type tricarboxylate transporter receptor subunit TctC
MGTALLLTAGYAPAQDFPKKTVKIIVGWAPGGGVDATARVVAKQLSQAWGQQVIVENRPGAAGNLAAELTTKAPADGYTIMLGSNGELAVNVSLYKKLPYDPLKELSSIAMAARVPNVLVANPAVPAKNIKELIAYSKQQPHGLNYASPGNGSIGHLTAELLKIKSGANMVHVPYKGAAPATIAVLSGEVQLSFSSIPAALPHIKSGKLKALAVTSAKRVAVLPDVPTIAESGFSDFDAVGWYAFVGPAGIPDAIITKLNKDIGQALQDPAVIKNLSAQGLEPQVMTPTAFHTYMASEITRWAEVVKASGSKVD